MSRIGSPVELEEYRKTLRAERDPAKPHITLCGGSACLATGSREVAAGMEAELEAQGLGDQVELRKTGCRGFCERGPVVVTHPDESCYLQVEPGDAGEIVAQSVNGHAAIDRLLYADPGTDERIQKESDIPFYRHQVRRVFGSNGSIDPKSIDDYLAIGGYAALEKALFQMTPEGVVEEVKRSKLRGRGGGGFPTGRKWEESRNAPGEAKYVIVNADEGDPGAYMDRSLLEGNPHLILEGLAIGAYAVGAHEGFIYVRQEYPLAVENIILAIEKAEEYGFLGKRHPGFGLRFHRERAHGRRRVRLRRVERPDDGAGRQGGRTPAEVHPHRGQGGLGPAQRAEQRRDLGQRAAHHQRRRRLVRRIRDRGQQGHQDLLPRGQDNEHRPGGSAHGHDPGRHHLQDRRRHPGRQEVQGRADRRAVGRLHPRGAARAWKWASTNSPRPAR